MNNSITRHKSNNYTACSRVELVEILKQHTNNFIATVHCQRFGTPNIYEDLRQLDIMIIDAKTKLVSKRKQRLPEVLYSKDRTISTTEHIDSCGSCNNPTSTLYLERVRSNVQHANAGFINNAPK